MFKREAGSVKYKKNRIWEIDFLRAIPIIIVVLYHSCFDVFFLASMIKNQSQFFSLNPNVYQFVKFTQDLFFNPFIIKYLVPFFGGLFLFICGVSSSLTRSNLRRALLLNLGALVFSLATYVFSIITKDDCLIFFGILHQMGFAILMYALLELIFRLFKKKVPNSLIFTIGFVILLIGIVFSSGIQVGNVYVKWGTSIVSGDFSKEMAKDPLGYLKAILGMKASYNDWWPIFPYTGVVFIGIFIGKIIYGKKKRTLLPCLKDCKVLKPFCFLGRHTIYVYILHQPIIIGIIFTIYSLLGGQIL